jgi:hypothetical protein
MLPTAYATSEVCMAIARSQTRRYPRALRERLMIRAVILKTLARHGLSRRRSSSEG